MRGVSIHGLRREIAVELRRIFERTAWWEQYLNQTIGDRQTRGRHVQVMVAGTEAPTPTQCRNVHRLLRTKLGRLKPYPGRRRCLDPQLFHYGSGEQRYRAIWFEFASQPKPAAKPKRRRKA